MTKVLHIDPNESEYMNMNTEEKIMWRAGQYEVPQVLSKKEAFEKLMNKIADNGENIPVIKLHKQYNYYWISAIAAAVIIFISVWFFWIHIPVENVIAEKGHQTDYRLPDGTMISLNADSKITYNKGKFNKKRNVTLEGEAFFNVEKGAPFTISTSLANIKILGTSFNVYARENSFRVSCFTGKILVTSGDQSVTIIPNETAYIENNKLIVKQENNINSTAVWRIGEFTFENTSLNLVFDELERQFNVTFVLPKIDDKNYTGGFTNKNLVEALDLICIPMDLTYEIGSNSKILIKNKSK